MGQVGCSGSLRNFVHNSISIFLDQPMQLFYILQDYCGSAVTVFVPLKLAC